MKVRLNAPRRPRRFADLVGNKSVIDALRCAVAKEAVPNLLVFTGPTGGGKTTLARILARRLLCEHSAAGNVEGCGECQPCQLDALDSHYYFEELDSADPNLEFRMEKFWHWHDARFVYFIDEVQELPRRTEIRLRKWAEEAQATIILATTHFDKLDDALKNRLKSYQYELTRPTADEVVGYLEREAGRLGVSFERRDQLFRVATAYQCEMRPCSKFMHKVQAESNSVAITDDYLDGVFGKSTVPARSSVSGRKVI